MVGAGIDGERGVEREFGAVGELHLAGGESVDADLRTLQIAEHADVAAGLARRLAHQLEPARVIGERAVREIEAHHVDAGAHHVGQAPRDRRWRDRASRRFWSDAE